MGRMDATMQAVAIMQEFGWTYQEYLDSPKFILTLIVEKMRRDRKEQELAANKTHRG